MMALYAGKLLSQTCVTYVTNRNTVDNAKNKEADVSSGVRTSSSSLDCGDGGAMRWVEAAALRTCTPLTATPTAACPDMTACIASCPNNEARATTELCR